MERFSKLLKDNLTTIMKILVSLFLCIVCSYWMGPETDYSLFVSMITGISIIAFIYEFLFTKKYKDALINILCAFSIFIATNHLYSTAHLIRFYNKINEIDKMKLLAIIIGSLVAIVFFFLLIYYFKNKKQFYNYDALKREYEKSKQTGTPTIKLDNMISKHNSFKDKIFYFGMTTSILLLLIAIIYVFFEFDIAQIISTNDFSDLGNYAKSVLIYAGIVLSALVILLFIVVLIVGIVKLMHTILFKRKNNKIEKEIIDKNSNQGEKTDDTGGKKNDKREKWVYFFSFVIVIITIIASVVSGLNTSLDNLKNIWTEAKFLVLPLVALAIIVLVGILVNITYTILNSLPRIPVEKIENVKGDVQEKIIKISKKLFFAILELIEAVIEFVTFVPDFFTSINKLISDEENEDENDI